MGKLITKLNKIIRVASLIISILVIKANIANAIIIEDFYEISLPVTTKTISAAQRKQLIQQAMIKLLFTMTGKSTEIQLGNPEQYVNKYEFIDVDDSILLKIYFDKKTISSMLVSNNCTFLEDNRPLTIVWPVNAIRKVKVVEDLLQRIIVLANQRKLPIVLPIMNAKEVGIIYNNVGTNRLSSLLISASKRYAADEVIIMGGQYGEYGQHVISLGWYSQLNNWQFTHEFIADKVDIEQQANAFIDQLTQHFLQQQANNNLAANKEVLLIKINNIVNLEDYIKVETYLKNLPVLSNFNANKFKPGEVEFELIATGGKQSIRNAIATSGLLEEKFVNINSNNKESDHNILYYDLN